MRAGAWLICLENVRINHIKLQLVQDCITDKFNILEMELYLMRDVFCCGYLPYLLSLILYAPKVKHSPSSGYCSMYPTTFQFSCVGLVSHLLNTTVLNL